MVQGFFHQRYFEIRVYTYIFEIHKVYLVVRFGEGESGSCLETLHFSNRARSREVRQVPIHQIHKVSLNYRVFIFFGHSNQLSQVAMIFQVCSKNTENQRLEAG